MTTLVTMIILMVFISILFSMFSATNPSGDHNGYGGTKIESTVEREPLPAGSVNETG